MTALVSVLSATVTATATFAYTNADLVSAVTDGEVQPFEVRPEWIQEAMEEIDRKCGMCFRPVNFQDKVDGNSLIRVFTRCFPLLEVNRVEVDGADLSPSIYVVNKRTGSVTLKNGVFEEGFQNVVIDGVSGYDKVPPLIEKIATLIVAKTALSAKNGALVDSESIGDFSQNRSFKKLNDELDRAWEAWGTRAGIDFAS
ncbi:MAG: hypothetical protein KCHDKBKB_02791 [Elusimicrobia bacterium]|nr:hypothetical protein [Elusimicrobiota bacterium]